MDVREQLMADIRKPHSLKPVRKGKLVGKAGFLFVQVLGLYSPTILNNVLGVIPQNFRNLKEMQLSMV